jgi:hypothetical protein
MEGKKWPTEFPTLQHRRWRLPELDVGLLPDGNRKELNKKVTKGGREKR